jgi:hypothetical protein
VASPALAGGGAVCSRCGLDRGLLSRAHAAPPLPGLMAPRGTTRS